MRLKVQYLTYFDKSGHPKYHLHTILAKLSICCVICITPPTIADTVNSNPSIHQPTQHSTKPIKENNKETKQKNSVEIHTTTAVQPALDYVYDDLGRLIQVKHQGVVVVDFQLDDMSNRINRSTVKQP